MLTYVNYLRHMNFTSHMCGLMTAFALYRQTEQHTKINYDQVAGSGLAALLIVQSPTRTFAVLLRLVVSLHTTSCWA